LIRRLIYIELPIEGEDPTVIRSEATLEGVVGHIQEGPRWPQGLLQEKVDGFFLWNMVNKNGVYRLGGGGVSIEGLGHVRRIKLLKGLFYKR